MVILSVDQLLFWALQKFWISVTALETSKIKLRVGQTFMSDGTGTINNVLLFSCCFYHDMVKQNLSVSSLLLFYFDWILNILKWIFSHSNADDLVKVLLKNFIIKEKTPQQLIRVTNGGWFCKYFLQVLLKFKFLRYMYVCIHLVVLWKVNPAYPLVFPFQTNGTPKNWFFQILSHA